MVSVFITVFVLVLVLFTSPAPSLVVLVLVVCVLLVSAPAVFVSCIVPLDVLSPAVVLVVVVVEDASTGAALVFMLSAGIVVPSFTGAAGAVELLIVEVESVLEDSVLPLPHEAIKRPVARAKMLSLSNFMIDD